MDGQINEHRSGILPMLALLKKQIEAAFRNITHDQVFRVRIEDQKPPAPISINLAGKEFEGISREIEALVTAVKQYKFSPPALQRIDGTVTVRNPQSFERLIDSLRALEQRVGSLQGPKNDPQVVSTLRSIDSGLNMLRGEITKIDRKPASIPAFPTRFNMAEADKILSALENLSKDIKKIRIPEMQFPTSISVSNFPPQKYPMPATHISINSLIGSAKSRTVTVTSTATILPGDSLPYRRSMIIFNNSSQTLYIGGDDVTTSNGLPIITQTYSPALDAGPGMTIYGIVASATADIRCFEVSDENSGK